MSPAVATVTISIVQLLFDKGIPAFIKLMKTLDEENVTLEDIEALHGKVKKPEEYFND